MSYHRLPRPEHYVYFVRAGDMMKIGCSRQPETRLMQIGEWVPFKMELVATLPGSFDLEAAFHAHFDASWSHLEWFHVTPEMEAIVAAINEGWSISLIGIPKDTAKHQVATAKKVATRRVTMAEKRRYGDGQYQYARSQRPQYLIDALNSYDGAHNPAPSDDALAAIARFEAECAAVSTPPVRKSRAA